MKREELIAYFDRRINAINRKVDRVSSDDIREMLIDRLMEAIEIAKGLGLNVKENFENDTYDVF